MLRIARPRHIGLILDRYDQPGWVRDIAARLDAEAGVEVHIILSTSSGVHRGGRIARLALGILQRLESRLLNRRELDLFHREDIRTQIRDATLGTLDSDVAPSQERFDVVVYFGDGAPPPELARLGRGGILTVDHGTGQPGDRHAAFLECERRLDYSHVRILRYDADETRPRVMATRAFHTQYCWVKNRARALSVGALALQDLLDAPWETRKSTPSPRMPALQEAPGLGRLLRYGAGQVSLIAGLLLRKWRRTDTQWRVALSDATADAALPHTLMPPAGTFYADPFVHERDGDAYVFFEEYAFSDRVGKISVARAHAGKFERLGYVLDLPYHLSFPFLFEFEGSLFMVPETSGARAIQLWRCVEFPLRWELDRTLMHDVSAVDTVLFPRDGRWWMLTNIDRTSNGDHSDELFAFYADTPLSDTWRPHALNPVITDPVRARNGGLVTNDDGSVMRCAQLQGFGHYGKGLSINRIEELTPTCYRETPGNVRYADFVDRPHPSMHHCHRHGGLMVFDYGFRR